MASDPRRRAAPPPPPPPPDERQQHPSSEDTSVKMEEQRPASTQSDTQSQSKNRGNDAVDPEQSFKLRFCTVCASNNNRSMEAHLRLTTRDNPSAAYPVLSFGTGSLVRLPGPSISQPNVYNFNSTSYATMHDELSQKDKRLYSANGILNMLERNKGVKYGPERWQDWKVGVPRVGKRATGARQDAEGGDDADYSADKGSRGTEAGVVDVVFTCEERCWDAVVDDLLTRGSPLNRPVHVFNVDIKDNHEEALVGGRAILELADALNAAATEEREVYVAKVGGAAFDQGSSAAREGFDERVPTILAEWQDRWPHLPALWTLAWF